MRRAPRAPVTPATRRAVFARPSTGMARIAIDAARGPGSRASGRAHGERRGARHPASRPSDCPAGHAAGVMRGRRNASAPAGPAASRGGPRRTAVDRGGDWTRASGAAPRVVAGLAGRLRIGARVTAGAAGRRGDAGPARTARRDADRRRGVVPRGGASGGYDRSERFRTRPSRSACRARWGRRSRWPRCRSRSDRRTR